MDKQKLLEEFEKQYGDKEGVKVYFAPGRLNLMGDHTDYNGGHVLPCALPMGTYGVARKREDDIIQMTSLNQKESGLVSFSLKQLNQRENSWCDYPKGVISTLCKKDYVIPVGMDLLFYGDVPNASGLSSSASLEVLMGFICRDIYRLTFDNVELSKLCQIAENEFVGVNCGIMDQFSIAMGKENQAIFLDTESLNYEYADLSLEDTCLVIMNTNVKRELGSSKYNERRKECEDAIHQLQKVISVRNLGELRKEDWRECKRYLNDDVQIRRTKHAVYENRRVEHALHALQRRDMEYLGRLMNESHESLRDDYEVSCKELDCIVEEAISCEGVLGARMTGAGFGGCAVCVVNQASVDAMIEHVKKAYQKETGNNADFYIVSACDGPRVIE